MMVHPASLKPNTVILLVQLPQVKTQTTLLVQYRLLRIGNRRRFQSQNCVGNGEGKQAKKSQTPWQRLGIAGMEFVLEQDKQLADDCPTLLLPALSIGNVGQLALDLLVSSTKAHRIGYLDHPFLLPCVGNDAYGPLPCGHLALPLEVYQSSSHALTLLQQRSPVVKGRMMEYAQNLANFAAASGMKHIVLLSSLDFGKLQRIDMSSGFEVCYLSSTSADGTDRHCESFGWKRLQDYNPAQRCWAYLNTLAEAHTEQEKQFPFEEELEEADYYPSLPFAALFSSLKAKGLKVTCLFCYCSEGDNIADAFNLAEAACKLLEMNPESFDASSVLVENFEDVVDMSLRQAMRLMPTVMRVASGSSLSPGRLYMDHHRTSLSSRFGLIQPEDGEARLPP